MAFRFLDSIKVKLPLRRHLAKALPSGEHAFADTSPKAEDSVLQFDQEVSRQAHRRFLELTGYEIVDAIRLPAKAFEAHFIPLFVKMYQEKYVNRPEDFDKILQVFQQEMTQVATQLQKETPAHNYLPYVDTFRVRVLREMKENLENRKNTTV